MATATALPPLRPQTVTAGCFFNSQKTTVPLLQPFETDFRILEQLYILDCCLANDDARHGTPFGDRFAKVTFQEYKGSNLHDWPDKFSEAAYEYGFAAAFRERALNIGR